MTIDQYDQDPYDQDDDDQDVDGGQVAPVVQLRPRPAEPGGTVMPREDVERELAETGSWGGTADPEPDPRPTLYATVTERAQQPRPPIVPAWVRSGQERRTVALQVARQAGYVTGMHVTRSPLYLVKVVGYAPKGLGRVVWRQVRWWWHPELHSLLQVAATAGNLDKGPPIEKQLADRRRSRGVVLLLELAGLIVAGALLAGLAPRWLQVAVAVPLVVILARVGRPAGRPITVRTYNGPRFVRLHADHVRTAVVAMGIVKEPDDITFPVGVQPDGPGWLARFNLPAGVEAVKLLERRNALSSALRLPVDQVWPSVGPDHAGQVDLWVGRYPASQMGAPRWELVSAAARVNVFDGYPVGHDERLRPVVFAPFEKNILIGGQPGAGKTYGGRAVVLGALLDPTAEVWLAAFKPAEDFYDVSPFCTRYLCGIDTVTMADGERLVADGLAEVQRRQTVLGKLKRAGRITEGRTSPELATAGLGLHPLFLIFDEVHELFLESKPAREDLIRLLKQGRSVGVIVVLITQVAGKDAVPPEVTRVVSTRWCMSVLDQVANDQIMGTGSYKRGLTGTVYRPGTDAGWGVTTGMSGTYVGPVRAYHPKPDDLAALLRRIKALRHGGGYSTSSDPADQRDFLADIRDVFRAGEAFVSWQQLAARLTEQLPKHYAGMSKDATGDRARALGVVGRPDGRDTLPNGRKGPSLKGAHLTDVQDAIARRQITGGES